jgi:hypothetical protein
VQACRNWQHLHSQVQQQLLPPALLLLQLLAMLHKQDVNRASCRLQMS